VWGIGDVRKHGDGRVVFCGYLVVGHFDLLLWMNMCSESFLGFRSSLLAFGFAESEQRACLTHTLMLRIGLVFSTQASSSYSK
jgi:hypothetical protein